VKANLNRLSLAAPRRTGSRRTAQSGAGVSAARTGWDALAPSFLERMQKVAQDFAQQHQADQKLPEKDREGYTLLLAMRSWEFEAFAAMRRSE
jgi:hypothetical protein